MNSTNDNYIPAGPDPRSLRSSLASWLKEREKESEQTKPLKLWDKCYDYYVGQQTWTKKSEAGFNVVDNRIRPLILTLASLWADSNLSPVISEEQMEDVTTAKILDQCVTRILRMNDANSLLIGSDTFSLLWGTSFISAEWNPFLANGLGDVELRLYSPYNVFPDPISSNPSDWRYLIETRFEDIDRLRAIFPSSLAREIVSESGVENYVSAHRKNLLHSIPSSRMANGTFVRRAWLRDVDLKKYPNGRHVIATDTTVLFDGPTPEDIQDWPLVRFVNDKIEGDPWGFGEVEGLINDQDELNYRRQQILIAENRMANPATAIRGPVNLNDLLDTTIGRILRLGPGAEIQHFPGIAMPNEIYRAVDRLRDSMEQKAGIYDVTQGRKSPGLYAGVAIQQLQEAAHTKIRRRDQLKKASLELLIRRVVKLIRRHYSPERYAEVVDGSLLLDYDYNELTNGWDRDLNITINIVPNRGYQRQEELQNAVGLLQAGVIDREAVLDRVPWADASAIKSRMATGENAALQQAMVEQMQGEPQEEVPSGVAG